MCMHVYCTCMCSYSGKFVLVNNYMAVSFQFIHVIFGCGFVVHPLLLLFSCLNSGAVLPEVKEKTEHFDSNCITPVSLFSFHTNHLLLKLS